MPTWNLTLKPSFLSEWQALPPKDSKTVASKLQDLTTDPTPDGKVKKRLKNLEGKLCRIRAGDYRVFYTFEEPYVSILGVRKRDEHTYAGEPEGENLGGPKSLPDAGEIEKATSTPPPKPTWTEQLDVPKRQVKKTPLREPIGEELLKRLSVPAAFVAKLVGIATEDDLLNCPDVPDDILLRVDQAVTERPFEEIAQQPELVANTVDDLVRYKNGELVGFLLRLDPDQAKFVNWGVKASGPTLLKGGPGTGKSVVALYRAQAMIAALRRSGVETPRLLFTTYTTALVSYSQSLLQSLLGADAKLVVVRTADSVARELADVGGMWKAPTESELKKLLIECRTKMTFAGNALQQRAQRQTIEKLGTDYLLEEILDVIDGRGLSSASEYESARRPGRDVPLNKTQRGAVWAAREAFHAALTARKLVTWEDLRARAAARAQTAAVPKYDGVIVDEAQDLSPTMLRMLASLSKSANRVFFTADANQSIYGASFRWQDVHADLKFQGRTGVLKANYRSTREIGEAANGYLAVGEIEDENVVQAFAKSGPLPAIRAVATTADEARLLERFVRSASKELRLGMGACAILVPSNDAGERIASALQARKIPTAFMHGKDLNLKSKSVKVITLKSAKGLEFPCVAVAGFVDGSFPFMPPNATDEERDEILKRERRTMYVAMTRAMHSLLLVVPKDATSALLTGFDTKAWNLGEVAT